MSSIVAADLSTDKENISIQNIMQEEAIISYRFPPFKSIQITKRQNKACDLMLKLWDY